MHREVSSGLSQIVEISNAVEGVCVTVFDEMMTVKLTVIITLSMKYSKYSIVSCAISYGFAVTYCFGLLSRTMHLKLFIFI